MIIVSHYVISKIGDIYGTQSKMRNIYTFFRILKIKRMRLLSKKLSCKILEQKYQLIESLFSYSERRLRFYASKHTRVLVELQNDTVNFSNNINSKIIYRK